MSSQFGLFEDISAFDEGTRVAHRKAVAVACKRVADSFGSFIRKANSNADRAARLALVDGDLKRIVAEVAEEYGTDTERLEKAIQESLGGDGVTDIDGELAEAPSAVGSQPLASAKTADADRDGGGAVKTEDLPTANDAGDLGGPSPEIDKTTWKPNALNDSGNLKPIDTEQDGSPVPTEQQDVTDTADHEKDFLDQSDAVTTQENLPSADDSGQSTERNIDQPHTDTFNNDGQADPVGGTVSSVDPDKNPLREILTSDFPNDHEVDQAINEFEGE